MTQKNWTTKQIHLLNLLAGHASTIDTELLEWKPLALWLIRVNLGAAAYQLLSPVYPELKSYLEKAYYENIYRAIAQKQVFQEMLSSLDGHKVDILLLKGAAVSNLAWGGQDYLRFQSDIDFLVQRPDLHTIATVLHGANFRFRKPDAIGEYYADLPNTNKEGQLEMVSPSDSQVVLEAHTEVFLGHVQRITAKRIENELWARRISATYEGLENHSNGIEFWRLSNEDLVLHTMVHTAINHQFDENALRNMLDVIRLADRLPIDWQIVQDRAKSMRMQTAVWLFAHISAKIWEKHPFERLLHDLSPSRLRQKRLLQLMNEDVILAGKILRLSRRRYLLLLLMIDRPIDMLRLLIRLPWLSD